MYIKDIFQQKKTTFSLEIFPPKKTMPIDTVYETINALKGIHPDFISVTYGAGGNIADMSTCEIASYIKTIGIEPLAHLTCIYSSKNDIDIILDQLTQRGIENILALRGDKRPGVEPKNDFYHASDLAKAIQQHGGFAISGACYPEGHAETSNIDQDIEYLKHKIDAGVTHLITQLFFDNNAFYHFIDKVRKAGITVPIEAGIMPIVNKNQIEKMVSLSGASLPAKFTKILSRFQYDKLALRDAGIAYAIEQIIDLMANGVDGIHLYTMNNPFVATKIHDAIASIRNYENQ